MSNSKQAPVAELLSKSATDAAMKFAMDALERMPKANSEELEAHITAVLIVFWGALWGTFGSEYARDFIEAQLRGMEPDQPRRGVKRLWHAEQGPYRDWDTLSLTPSIDRTGLDPCGGWHGFITNGEVTP